MLFLLQLIIIKVPLAFTCCLMGSFFRLWLFFNIVTHLATHFAIWMLLHKCECFPERRLYRKQFAVFAKILKGEFITCPFTFQNNRTNSGVFKWDLTTLNMDSHNLTKSKKYGLFKLYGYLLMTHFLVFLDTTKYTF